MYNDEHKHLEIIKFRERHYQKWTKYLQILNGKYDFEAEARSLIEDALLAEGLRHPPVNGKDIMDALNIPPGKEVGRLRQIAQNLYQGKPELEKDELLNMLREHI